MKNLVYQVLACVLMATFLALWCMGSAREKRFAEQETYEPCNNAEAREAQEVEYCSYYDKVSLRLLKSRLQVADCKDDITRNTDRRRLLNQEIAWIRAQELAKMGANITLRLEKFEERSNERGW